MARLLKRKYRGRAKEVPQDRLPASLAGLADFTDFTEEPKVEQQGLAEPLKDADPDPGADEAAAVYGCRRRG